MKMKTIMTTKTRINKKRNQSLRKMKQLLSNQRTNLSKSRSLRRHHQRMKKYKTSLTMMNKNQMIMKMKISRIN